MIVANESSPKPEKQPKTQTQKFAGIPPFYR
jgi:hypothetical protein